MLCLESSYIFLTSPICFVFDPNFSYVSVSALPWQLWETLWQAFIILCLPVIMEINHLPMGWWQVRVYPQMGVDFCQFSFRGIDSRELPKEDSTGTKALLVVRTLEVSAPSFPKPLCLLGNHYILFPPISLGQYCSFHSFMPTCLGDHHFLKGQKWSTQNTCVL